MTQGPKGRDVSCEWQSHSYQESKCAPSPKGARLQHLEFYHENIHIHIPYPSFLFAILNKISRAVPQSLVKNYLHITFSTKHRIPLISESFADELHNYLAGICFEHECYPIKIGGYNDHVHLVCSLSRKITLSSFIEHLKTSSSKWIKTKGEKLKDFYWQGGYYAVSVNPADLQNLIDYVENQRKHHGAQTYQSEVISILEKNNIPYDERYVWD